jgi:hypothetical protein
MSASNKAECMPTPIDRTHSSRIHAAENRKLVRRQDACCEDHKAATDTHHRLGSQGCYRHASSSWITRLLQTRIIVLAACVVSVAVDVRAVRAQDDLLRRSLRVGRNACPRTTCSTLRAKVCGQSVTCAHMPQLACTCGTAHVHVCLAKENALLMRWRARSACRRYAA